MAISDTYTFNPDISDIAEEAFEIAGTRMESGNDIRTARRSLNYMAIEWQNKGLNLWRVEEAASIAMVASTATYNIDIDTFSILDAYIRTDAGVVASQSDLMITRVSSTTYTQIPNKLTTGRPVQYYFNRIGIRDGTSGGSDLSSTVTMWPVPDASSTYQFIYWRIKAIADTGNDASNTMQIPDRFLPALVSGLAYKIAQKKPRLAGRLQMLEMEKNKLLEEAMEEDREKASLYILPDLSEY